MPAVTNLVPGNGTGTVTFTIPGNGLDVETVYVDIDASLAGAGVTAELTIQDQSGVVIARKTQGSTVTAGGLGSATWGLRLDDAAAGGGGITLIESLDGSIVVTNGGGPVVDLSGYKAPTAFQNIQTNIYQNIGAGATGSPRWNNLGGSLLLNLTNPVVPKVNTAGIYAFTGFVDTLENVNAGSEMASTFAVATSGSPLAFVSTYIGPTGGQTAGLGVAGVLVLATTDTFRINVFNGDTIAHNVGINNIWVQKVT